MSEAERLADEMAEAAIYLFKIQGLGKESDDTYRRVRQRAEDLLWTAVEAWKNRMK